MTRRPSRALFGMMRPIVSMAASASTRGQRMLCIAAKKAKLHQDPSGAELWRRGQHAVGILPELSMKLEAARNGTYESRSALAVHLAQRWTVETVQAQQTDTSVVATYALRVDGADLALVRASIWPEGPDLSEMRCGQGPFFEDVEALSLRRFESCDMCLAAS